MTQSTEVVLHPDLQALMELVQKKGFKCKKFHRADGPAVLVVVDGENIHLSRAYDILMATDRIPGIPMFFIAHGDLRYEVCM